MRDVSQISPPIRIVLVAAIGLIAAWMLFLRPKAEETPAPTPASATAPGVEGLTNAVDKAKGAAATQEASDAKVQAATGGSTGTAVESAPGEAHATPEAATTAQTALATGRVLQLAPVADKTLDGLSPKIRTALERRHVLVLAVFNTRNKPWAPLPADDADVRRSLKHVNRYGGNVQVAETTLNGLSKLQPVIGDLDVTQTPSVVVVDRNRQANVIAGYLDKVSINQAIAYARRNSIAFRVKGAYLTSLNETCSHYGLRIDRFALPHSRGTAKAAVVRLSRLVGTYERRFAALKAPARFKGLQGQIMKVVRADKKAVNGLRTAVAKNDLAKAQAVLAGYDVAAAVALDKRLDKVGVTSCVGNRKS